MPPENKCEYPDCPPKEMLEEMRDDIKSILKSTGDQNTANANLANLIIEVKEIKTENNKNHDEIFNRLRDVEMKKLDKSDAISLIIVMGVIFTIISIIIKWAVK